MLIRDRIRELRRVPANSLRANPRNWRQHPPAQQAALKGILTEIGYADALLARELPDGALELIDGHLRAETTPDALVPVLVLDLDEAEATKLLVTLDPLAGLATTNETLLAELLNEVESAQPDLQNFWQQLLPEPATPPPDLAIPQLFQIVIDCPDESAQEHLFHELKSAGHNCRVVNL